MIFNENDTTSYDQKSFKSHRPSLRPSRTSVSDDELEMSSHSTSSSTGSGQEREDGITSAGITQVSRRKSVVSPGELPGAQDILARRQSQTDQVRRRSVPTSVVPVLLTPPARRASVAVPATTKSSIREKGIGYGCCLVSGIANGLSMIPLKYSPIEAQGIIYVLSFSIGVAILTPVIFAGYFGMKREIPKMKARVAWPWATVGGVLWATANFAATYAVILLGITVGVPLCQCALVVAALWGVVFFREIRGRLEIGIFSLGAVTILGGAFMLGRFG
jgi:hypothetical protein